jgi:hypothetical protein
MTITAGQQTFLTALQTIGQTVIQRESAKAGLVTTGAQPAAVGTLEVGSLETVLIIAAVALGVILLVRFAR